MGLDNLLSIIKALEDLSDVLYFEKDCIEFIYCSVNNTVDWSVKPQSLQYFELSLYKGGNTQVETEGKCYVLNQNNYTLFDINKGYNVKLYGGLYHYITFGLTEPQKGTAYITALKNACSVLEDGVKTDNYFSTEKLIYEIHREFLLKRPYYKKRISLMIQDMLILLIRLLKQNHNENKVQLTKQNHIQTTDKVLEYLENHYTETVRLDDIAAATGYTQRYIDTIFKQTTGYTIIDYLTKIRIESSRKALLSSCKSITEIAMDCGFDSSSYFCKVFKKVTGQSPSEFRNFCRLNGDIFIPS